MSYVWSIVIGFVAALVVQVATPGRDQPSSFVVTTIVGIVGALLATWLGQALGWYGSDQRAVIAETLVGSVVVLLIWSVLSRRRGA